MKMAAIWNQKNKPAVAQSFISDNSVAVIHKVLSTVPPVILYLVVIVMIVFGTHWTVN